ncbi:DUF2301 domain-containing membrane protein [Oscillatoria sp. FACHB-1406]|uniref:DUF2301 domain-containing membrane protein n=1 Tax=Oscillatoria sp. FACHB-1406 TaxID=2692846 RepID=UPI001689506A|nr:DUF2301 domain-containing membrane protein [Oscillatoria sp. FACHB-1406]MBD2579122.1 DUF2301 domain-containing membrane protein [Oscillatoria sp. FACHB-1406]
MVTVSPTESEVYQGQFGEFTITPSDRRGVLLYRTGLCVAALSFAAGSAWVLLAHPSANQLALLTPLFWLFCAGLALSLLTIHIYLAALHRLLQAFLLVGAFAAIFIALQRPESLAWTVYHYPVTLLGIGFSFAALTGIFFKEAFCFNRFETKFLTPLVPLLLLGHWAGVFSVGVEQGLLAAWSILFLVFALRKVIQPIPPDIGDKSVFEYLKMKAK